MKMFFLTVVLALAFLAAIVVSVHSGIDAGLDQLGCYNNGQCTQSN